MERTKDPKTKKENPRVGDDLGRTGDRSDIPTAGIENATTTPRLLLGTFLLIQCYIMHCGQTCRKKKEPEK